MRFLWAATAAVLLVSGAARADSPAKQPEKGDAAVSVGIICNTPQQAEQFVGYRKKGVAAEQAMRSVNATARDQRACGVAAVAYVRDTTVDTMALENRLVQIVRINIVAGFNGSDWQKVSDTVQYAVLDGEGESI